MIGEFILKDSKNNISLNSAEKVSVRKTMNTIVANYQRLYDLLDKNELTEVTSEDLLESIEDYFLKMSRELNYKPYLIKEREKQEFEIRKANARIRELEENEERLRMKAED